MIEVNWDDAPVGATVARYYREWFKVDDNDDFIILNATEIVGQYERPKPKIEVGQVWQYKGGSKYQIDSIGRMKLVPHTGWIDCVTFRKLEGSDVGAFFTRTLLDFIAKFERVS